MGQYKRWLFGLLTALFTSLLINMPWCHLSPDYVSTHIIRRRDVQQQVDPRTSQIIAKLNQREPKEAANIYNNLAIVDRLSILPSVIQKFYTEEKVWDIIAFVEYIRENRRTEQAKAFQYLIEEMSSHKQLEQFAIMHIDCFLSSKFNETDSSTSSIIEGINRALKGSIEKMAQYMAFQVIQPDSLNGSLIQTLSKDYVCMSFHRFDLCYRQKIFKEVVQKAITMGTNDDMKKIVAFVNKLGQLCSGPSFSYGNTDKELIDLYKEMKQSCNIIEDKNTPRLATNQSPTTLPDNSYSPSVPFLQDISRTEYYINKMIKETYSPTASTELELICFVETLYTKWNNTAVSAMAYLLLYKEMEKINKKIELRSMLALARSVQKLRNDAKFLQLTQKKRNEINNLWEKKLPWHIVAEEPLCLANNKYHPDHLMIRSDDSVMSVRMVNPASYEGKGLKWTFPSNGTYCNIESHDRLMRIEATDDMILCKCGKRKISWSYLELYSWEVQDYDWKNNLFLLFNVQYNGYLYSDDELRLVPPAGRQVYLGKIQNPVAPASVWRITQC